MGVFVKQAFRVATTTSVVMAVWASVAAGARAEERTISMYHIHTKERITITYWKDGRFIPSALKKLNWFLRDWRKNKAVRMDPRTIDLIWKLHEDLGSKKPVWIICGHRSAATNAMLRRIGRKVAKRSRHITGQAIDFRFPDVPNWKVRNLALAYGIGGVGYYGEGRNSFIHADTGRVRHWPRLPARKLAMIKTRWRSYIGYRYRRPGGFMIAAARRKGKAIQVASRKSGQKRILKLARSEKPVIKASAAKGPISLVPLPKARNLVKGGVQMAMAVPMPRPRPYEVLVQAATTMEILPASAPASETNFAPRNPARDQMGMMIARVAPEVLEGGNRLMAMEPTPEEDLEARRRPDGTFYPRVNRAGKGDLALDILEGRARNVPVIGLRMLSDPQVIDAALKSGDMERIKRYYGAPIPMARPAQQTNSAQKGDLAATVPDMNKVFSEQRVNRVGKGDLMVERLRKIYGKRRLTLGMLAADRDDLLKAQQPLSLR